MSTPVHRPRLSAEGFANLPDEDRRHELAAGWVISEPLPSPLHDRVRRRVERRLDRFVTERRLGEVFGEAGFVLARDPDTVRGPDVSFVRAERLDGLDESRFIEGAPDLAVEVLSPSNRPYQVRSKVAEYLAAGCRLVWVVDPVRREVVTYRSVLAPRTAGEMLDGGDVLEGLRIPVASLFED